MKKIERIGDAYSQHQLLYYGIFTARINALIDSHNELLDTHTVKEPTVTSENCVTPIPIDLSKYKEDPTTPEKDERVWLTIKDMEGNEKIRMAYKVDVDALEHPMGNPKKETATPEKKCCENPMCPFLQEEKPQTSSYEVTCGRCEKSFYHKCESVK